MRPPLKIGCKGNTYFLYPQIKVAFCPVRAVKTQVRQGTSRYNPRLTVSFYLYPARGIHLVPVYDEHLSVLDALLGSVISARGKHLVHSR